MEKDELFCKLFIASLRLHNRLNKTAFNNIIGDYSNELKNHLDILSKEVLNIANEKVYDETINILIEYIADNCEKNKKYLTSEDFMTIFNARGFSKTHVAVKNLGKISDISEDTYLTNRDKLEKYLKDIKPNNKTLKTDAIKLLETMNSLESKEKTLQEKLDWGGLCLDIMKCDTATIESRRGAFSLKKIAKCKKLLDWFGENPEHLKALIGAKRRKFYL